MRSRWLQIQANLPSEGPTGPWAIVLVPGCCGWRPTNAAASVPSGALPKYALRRSSSGFTTSRRGHRLRKPQLVHLQSAVLEPTDSASQDSQTALNAARTGASNAQGSGVEVFGLPWSS